MQKVLVLNSSYLPTGVISWRKSIKLLYQDKADILEHSKYNVRTVNSFYNIPNVIRLKSYNSVPFINYKYCRKNVYKRDKYKCRYCNKSLRKDESNITIDHIIPRSRGGKDTWENTVTACRECNLKKKNCTPDEAGMKILPGDMRPTYFKNLASINGSWEKYLPIKSSWNSPEDEN